VHCAADVQGCVNSGSDEAQPSNTPAPDDPAPALAASAAAAGSVSLCTERDAAARSLDVRAAAPAEVGCRAWAAAGSGFWVRSVAGARGGSTGMPKPCWLIRRR